MEDITIQCRGCGHVLLSGRGGAVIRGRFQLTCKQCGATSEVDTRPGSGGSDDVTLAVSTRETVRDLEPVEVPGEGS